MDAHRSVRALGAAAGQRARLTHTVGLSELRGLGHATPACSFLVLDGERALTLDPARAAREGADQHGPTRRSESAPSERLFIFTRLAAQI